MSHQFESFVLSFPHVSGPMSSVVTAKPNANVAMNTQIHIFVLASINLILK